MRLNERDLRHAIYRVLLEQEQADAETSGDITSKLSKIISLSDEYFSSHPNAGVTGPGPLNKLPSTSAEGDTGKAATTAQKASAEEADWSGLDIPKLLKQHPQIYTAAILLMPSAKAIEIMDSNAVTDVIGAEIISGVAKIKKIPVDAMKKISDAIGVVLPEQEKQADGEAKAKELYTALDSDKQRSVHSVFLGSDTDFALHMLELRFTIQDIIKLKSQEVMALINELDTREIAYALSGASEDLKKHFIDAMSASKAAEVDDEMTAASPSKAEVVEAQEHILDVVYRLKDAGKINLPTSGQKK